MNNPTTKITRINSRDLPRDHDRLPAIPASAVEKDAHTVQARGMPVLATI
jgi:hypothetical protein